MRNWLVAVVAAALAASALAAEPAPLKTPKDKVSYAIGLNIGKSMKEQNVDLDPDVVARGIRDALGGARPALTEEEMREAMAAFQKEIQAKAAEERKTTGERNLKEGEAFLAANRKREGVKTTASGLQYKVIKDGDGRTPKGTDTVRVHYRGTLLDGREFDSSHRRGEPAEFQVDRVIAGWTEALQMMKVGSTWQLFIPAELAYKARGAPGSIIGPHATLIFEVELLGIK